MFEQLKVLDEKGTFVPVDPRTLSKTQYKKIINSFMFLTEKFDPNGNFLKLKARLVANGSQQNKEEIFINTSSPTVLSTHVNTIITIAAVENISTRVKLQLVFAVHALQLPNRPTRAAKLITIEICGCYAPTTLTAKVAQNLIESSLRYLLFLL